MPKVTGPLFSLKAVGQFGKSLIFKRGGVVVNYFKPRNPNSAAQQAQREIFKELYVMGLTQEQADLLYAVLLHQHDDLYAALGHLHDERYLMAGQEGFYIYGMHGQGAQVNAGATHYLTPFIDKINTTGTNVVIPISGVLKKLYFVTGITQPATGSLVVTVQINTSNSSLALTVPANGAGGVWTNATSEVSVNAGDLLRLSIKNNASSSSTNIGTASFMLYPNS
jgi:hypothetical protein